MQLEEQHLDAISEFINIGVGKAAQILNDMLEAHVVISLPKIQIFESDKLSTLFSDIRNKYLAMVHLSFEGDLTGNSVLVFQPESAIELVMALTGEEADSPDLDSLKGETLNEVGNILMNGVMGSISNITKQNLNFTIPIYKEESMEELLKSFIIEDHTQVLMIQSCFTIQNYRTEGSILIFFDVASLKNLAKTIDDLISGL